MSGEADFFDTTVVLHRLSANSAKADRAEAVLASGGAVSAQVSNEFVAVVARKLHMASGEIREVLGQVPNVCGGVPLTIETHHRAVRFAERHGLSVHGALIVSAALLAGCKTLLSEDMQDDRVIERQLTIRNPFAFA